MTCLSARLILATASAMAFALPAFAEADGPDAWRVVGVAPDDVLNARVGPGTDYFVIATLPHDARGVQLSVCVPTTTTLQYFALSGGQQAELAGLAPWCLVSLGGEQLGWVHRRFLAEDAE